MIGSLVFMVLGLFAIVVWLGMLVTQQAKMIRVYETMVDNAIKNLSAVDRIASFGVENNMHINGKAVHEQSQYVLHSLQKDKADVVHRDN